MITNRSVDKTIVALGDELSLWSELTRPPEIITVGHQPNEIPQSNKHHINSKLKKALGVLGISEFNEDGTIRTPVELLDMVMSDIEVNLISAKSRFKKWWEKI